MANTERHRVDVPDSQSIANFISRLSARRIANSATVGPYPGSKQETQPAESRETINGTSESPFEALQDRAEPSSIFHKKSEASSETRLVPNDSRNLSQQNLVPSSKTSQASLRLSITSQPQETPPIERASGHQGNPPSTAAPPHTPTTIREGVAASSSNAPDSVPHLPAALRTSSSKKQKSTLNPLAPQFHSRSIIRARTASAPQRSRAAFSAKGSPSPLVDSQTAAMDPVTPNNPARGSASKNRFVTHTTDPGGSNTRSQPSPFAPSDSPLGESKWSRNNDPNRGSEPWNKWTNPVKTTPKKTNIHREHVEQGKEYMRAKRASETPQETLPEDGRPGHATLSAQLTEINRTQAHASLQTHDPNKGVGMDVPSTPFGRRREVTDKSVAKESEALFKATAPSSESPVETVINARNGEKGSPFGPPTDQFAALKLSTERDDNLNSVETKAGEDSKAKTKLSVSKESHVTPEGSREPNVLADRTNQRAIGTNLGLAASRYAGPQKSNAEVAGPLREDIVPHEDPKLDSTTRAYSSRVYIDPPQGLKEETDRPHSSKPHTVMPRGPQADVGVPRGPKGDIIPPRGPRAHIVPPSGAEANTAHVLDSKKTAVQQPAVDHADEANKEGGEDRGNKDFFDKWPAPIPRARPGQPPSIRHVHLTNLPIDCNLAAVQGLVWGGPLETIEFVRKSGNAKIGFLSPEDCEKYWQDTTTGVEFPGKPLWKFRVERADNAIPLPTHLWNYRRECLRRCLSIHDMDQNWTVDYLKKVAEGQNGQRPTENVLVNYPSGQPRWALLRFMNITHAIEFRNLAARDVDWVKHDVHWRRCHIQFVPDPCEQTFGLHS
ncbi:MAG: hypothetical protein M1831_002229 [Alyxoria varia]|nr:MAG: hypothetical protein M1831_002229 [Alyxoria varia]